jgi:hypothetical protein
LGHKYDHNGVLHLTGFQKFAGVATAVFRKASNGMQCLEEVNRTSAINIQLVAQEVEGKLGMFTASAVSKRSTKEIVSWDSGVCACVALLNFVRVVAFRLLVVGTKSLNI